MNISYTRSMSIQYILILFIFRKYIASTSTILLSNCADCITRYHRISRSSLDQYCSIDTCNDIFFSESCCLVNSTKYDIEIYYCTVLEYNFEIDLSQNVVLAPSDLWQDPIFFSEQAIFLSANSRYVAGKRCCVLPCPRIQQSLLLY